MPTSPARPARRRAHVRPTSSTSRRPPPLTARSVLASTLLGAHDPAPRRRPRDGRRAVRHQRRRDPHLSVADGRQRRATADDGTYALAGPLLERRRRSTTPPGPPVTPAVGRHVGARRRRRRPARRPIASSCAGGRRAAPRRAPRGRLGPPDNLDPERLPTARAVIAEQCVRFRDAASDLTIDAIAGLFDLGTWATHAHRSYERSATSSAPPRRPRRIGRPCSTSSRCRSPPSATCNPTRCSPPSCSPNWPAEDLRTSYRAFDTHFQTTMNTTLAGTRAGAARGHGNL